MRLIFFYRVFFIGLVLSFSVSTYSQDRKSLEGVKSNNIQKLKYTRKLLEANARDKQKNISGLYILNQGIEYRLKLIKNYEEELDYILYDIEYMENEILKGKKDLDDLKKTYENIVKASYRNLDNEFWLMYILSSSDINQSYRRYKYLKYINDYRSELYEDIVDKNEYLRNQIDSLEILQMDKLSTKETVQEERVRLLNSQNEKIALQKDLIKKEAQLLKQVKEQEEIQKRIELEIKKLIEEEARKAREANRINRLTPAEKIIDGNFGNNRGGLPWPTEQGILTGKYGERAHPVLRGIKIKSNGIDISTTEDSKVRAVFNGEVTKVIAILGANYTVIIKHGNYRTVYQNLISVNVKAGDKVEIKEYIGSLGEESGKAANLHFELWNKMEALNPESWLSK